MDALTSDRLTLHDVYSREALRDLFGITDATLKNGIFHPKGTRSIWLFITEEKTKDRTQYRDKLVGGTLEWESQRTGRSDHKIIDHKRLSLEVLVFFRRRKYEFPSAGFRYLGPADYLSHEATTPARFRMQLKDSPPKDNGPR